LARQARQRELLAELFDMLQRHTPEALDPVFHPAWKAAADDAARLRVVVDQVASLTDSQAVRWHRELSATG
jgi:dGTPase